ncbi:hypothetical protein FPV67DRAFT_1093599, partial [Lyophyllum atratum]
MASDPRVHKPRLPKAYTDQQLTFLKSHLSEFERRSQGSIRGDAKKFALERASDFVARFGLPDEFVGVHESETRFREQIYNWFKNTVGRNRRKLEGRPRSSKRSPEKAREESSQPDITWNPVNASPIIPYSHAESSASPVNSTQSIVATVRYATLQPPTPIIPTPIPPPAVSPHITLTITQSTIRDAFLQGVDSSTLATMIQTFAIANPSPTPLTAVVEALFEAVSSDSSSSRFNNHRDPHACLRRYLDASTYFSPSVVHAGVAGPLAGPRALQMQIRKFSMWVPTSIARAGQRSPRTTPAASTSITDEMQRIAGDRQRRKDHIQWANIHAAALELGMLGMGHAGDSDNSGYAYAMGRAFSEMMARDAVWEADEVEWVAGICILRAVIRTAMRGDRRQRDEYDELLRTYERRWKEIKDEARQSLVTEVLLSAKDELARLDESLR